MRSAFASILFFASFFFVLPPASARETRNAPEQVLVEEAQARAIVSQKPVLVLVTATWCPPCNTIHKAFAERAAEFDPVLAQYEFVELEDTWTKKIPYDYVGLTMIGYPSFHLWDPRTNAWNSMAAYGEIDVILDELSNYAKLRERFAAFYWNRFKEQVAAGELFGDEDALGRLGSLGLFLGSAFTVDESTAKFQEIIDLRKAHPDQFSFASEDDFLSRLSYGLTALAGRPGSSIGAVRALFPIFLTDELLDSDPYYLRNFLFDVELGKRMREAGRETASAECESIRGKMLERATAVFTPDQVAAIQVKTKLACNELAFTVGAVSPADAVAYIEGLTEDQRKANAEAVWVVYAYTGDFSKAELYAGARLAKLKVSYPEGTEIGARVTKGYAELFDAFKAGKVSPNAK